MTALCLVVDAYMRNATGARASAAMKVAAIVAGARPTVRVVDVGDTTLTLNPNAPPDISYGVPLLQLEQTTLMDRLQTTGARQAYCLTAAATTVNVALAWTDPPPHINASPVLVNDLDLVVSSAGVEYTLNNNRDVSERVIVPATPGAVIRVTVDVDGLVSNYVQNYSLAAVGATGPVPCGTCLSGDRTTCGAGSVPLCDDWGNTTCVINACPDGQVLQAGSCVAASGGPCDVAHGGGLLVGDTCTVHQCDPDYYALANACVCLPTKECGSVVVQCVGNEFISCADAAPETFDIQDESVPPAPSATYQLGMGLLVFALALMLCVCVCPLVLPDPDAPPRESAAGPKLIKAL